MCISENSRVYLGEFCIYLGEFSRLCRSVTFGAICAEDATRGGDDGEIGTRHVQSYGAGVAETNGCADR